MNKIVYYVQAQAHADNAHLGCLDSSLRRSSDLSPIPSTTNNLNKYPPSALLVSPSRLANKDYPWKSQILRSLPTSMCKENFQILSDLHLESPAAYDIFHVEPKAPYLCLIGDIGYVRDDGLFSFLRSQLEVFQIVFLVLGNHEPYHTSWSEAKKRVDEFQNEFGDSSGGKALGKLVLLDQTRYDVSSNLTVLGCTLFSRISESQAESVSFGLNDFYHIYDWSVDDHQKAHLSDLAWLNEEISSISSSEPDRKIIVLTHYSPTTNEKAIDSNHAASQISSGFMTDLTREACWKNGAVKVWAFGHTHFNCDLQDKESSKRVISNQRGYYFSQAKDFDLDKVVEV